ncbi:alpha/beta hydrolase family protein [Actinophytocola sp.]|uniref:alpha/beta hydrolase n=1 Tax=Actinophytocola sp. TaxID=1872138 RepID=UPI002D26EE62|nr:alpha/beta hydrolase family protein [Actinophytocola sp.]HYQ64923.1 alpha/beta hydrolase family protein [Actinophytocola sp.]
MVRFKGFLLALVLVFSTLLTVPAAAVRTAAWVVSTTRLDDRLVELVVRSPAVGHDVGVRLLLPPDYDRHPGRRWPTLYLLHGCCDGDTGFRSWTDKTDVEELSAHTNVLIVMPEGGPGGFYSDWLSGPRWETFHLTELRRIVEHEYRSGPRRAVAGLSMGGFGALSYAGRHPGFFRAVASFSGVAHPTYQGARSTRLVLDIVRGTGADPLGLWGDPVANADVWAAHNPFDLARRLRGTKVFISAGNGEAGPFDAPGSGVDGLEQLLGEQSVAVADQLRRYGIPVRTDFYGPGHHAWPYWERELHRSFPMLVWAVAH